MKKALRLDRPVAEGEAVPVFDLELLHRSVRDSLLVATMFRRPARYLKALAPPGGSPDGQGGAAARDLVRVGVGVRLSVSAPGAERRSAAVQPPCAGGTGEV